MPHELIQDKHMRDTEYLDIAYRVAPLVELEAHGALSVFRP